MLDGAAEGVWGAFPGVPHRAGELVCLDGWWGHGALERRLRSHTDPLKHETLLSSFSRGERHAKRGEKK